MNNLLKLLLMLLVVMCLSVSLFSCDIPDIDAGEDGGNSDDGGNNGNGENDGNNNGESDAENENRNDTVEGGDKTPGSSDTEEELLKFTVLVLDSDGNVKKNVKVTLYDKDGTPGNTVVSDKKGIATFKKVKKGNYTFTLSALSSDEELIYSKELCTLSESQKDVTVTVYSRLTEKNYSIYGDGLNSNEKAYSLSDGSAYLKLPKGRITYVVFTPQRNGVYTFSATGTDNVLVANLGIADYVLKKKLSEFSDGECSINVAPLASSDSTYTPTCFAVYSENGDDALISVSRTSDLPSSPEYVKWIEIQPKNTPDKQEFSAGTVFNYLNVADENLSVTLGSDGYYHLGDENGKIIYINLTKNTAYIDAITTIRENSGINAYIYDASGKFVRKESYDLIIDAYAKICDTRLGICPLTEELANAIITHGEHKGWWNLEADGNVFVEHNPFIIAEVAWLFACGTVD